jgi:hypothetical protein
MKTWNIFQGMLNSIISGVYGLVGLGVTGQMDLSDAPGGELSLDDIFGENSSTPTTVEVAPANSQATTPEEPFLKAKTGTVYKTREDAITGVEHKDALITQLREQLKGKTGEDPIVRQPQGTQPVSYVEHPDRYFEDIAKAVNKGDQRGYMDVQQRMIWETLGPLAPTITSLSRANAERVVSEQLPEFKGFLGSDAYKNIEQEAPLLAEAIKAAEGNPQASAQLPELYKVAYLASRGRDLPEIVKSVRNESPQVQPRPTVHSQPVSPASSSNAVQATPSLDNKEGRKAIIERFEGQGLLNQKF